MSNKPDIVSQLRAFQEANEFCTSCGTLLQAAIAEIEALRIERAALEERIDCLTSEVHYAMGNG